MAEKKKFPNVDKSFIPDKDDLLQTINRAVREAPVIKEHHGTWKELIEWTDEGNQFSEWDGDKLIPVKLKKRKKRVVINLMKPLIEAIEGKINMFYRIVGFPNSHEQKDIEGSKVATKVNEHIDYSNQIEVLNEDLKYDLTRTGNAWRTWQWDKDMEVQGKNGKITGEIVGSVPSVFHIRPDPTGKTRDKWRYLVAVAEVTEDQITRKFEVEKSELDTAISDASNKAKGQSGARLDKYYGMNEPAGEKDIQEDTYIIAYYWEKKTPKFSEGRLIITLADTDLIFWAKKNPALGEIPFFKYRYKRRGNSTWGTGPCHHVQPIQRELNRHVSIVSEHLEGWRAKMLVPEGAIIKKGAYTTDSFELLEADLTKGEIKPLSAPELSPQYRVQIDFLMGAFNLVANVHEVSYSQLPKYASRAPATLFSMMLEQENMKMDPMIREMNQTIKEEAKFKLRLADKYYTTDRLLKILGTGKETQIEYYKSASMESNFDVKLEIGVSLNQSKTVQQRLLMELKTMGAPIEWNKIYKLLQEGDVTEELRGDIADETKAIRENQAFINDNFAKPVDEGGVEIYMHDDHEIHMDYHTNLRKEEEVQRWDKNKIAFLDYHIKQHYMLIMQLKMMQEMAAQAPGPGGGPGMEEEVPPEEGSVSPEVRQTRQASPFVAS